MKLISIGSSFNTAIFKSLDSHDYRVLVVDESFLQGAPFESNPDHYISLVPSGYSSSPQIDEESIGASHNFWSSSIVNGSGLLRGAASRISGLQSSVAQLQRLETKECLTKYSSRIMTGRQDVLAVIRRERYLSSQANFTYQGFRNGSLLHLDGILLSSAPNAPFDSKGYFCSDLGQFRTGWDPKRCGVSSMNATDWHIFGFPVEYCLSQPIKQRCRLEYSQLVGIIIVVCNALKLCCMVFTAMLPRTDTMCTQG